MEFVTFIQVKGKNGPVYIGHSADPCGLLSTLQAANPDSLVLLGSVDSLRYPLEWWRELLMAWNIHGAWYQGRAQVLCRIEDALNGRLSSPTDACSEVEPVGRLSEVRIVTKEERLKAKWAWPVVEPFPKVEAEAVLPSQAAPVVLQVLRRKLSRDAA